MKLKNIRTNKYLKLLFLPVILIFLSGCVYLVVGGIGAVGGYVVSPDTVEGVSENDSLTVWETAREIVGIMGIVLEEQESIGVMTANVSGAHLTITVYPLNDSTTKLTVKARKAYLPKISAAQNVFVKIMDRLGD